MAIFLRQSYFFMLILLLVISSCTSDDSNSFELSLSKTLAPPKASNQFVKISADGAWNIALHYEGEATDWCTLNKTSGEGSSNSIILSYEANTADSCRSVQLIATQANKTTSVTLTQLEQGNSAYFELPSLETNEGQMIVSHSTQLNGSTIRNYTMLFDTNERIALWVAYPHCSAFIGSSGRSDAWQTDPKIDSEYQMTTTMSGYNRGHQLPSGDRTCDYNTNTQTFYYSNQTPQLWTFNGYIWVEMESRVRTYVQASSCDSLYVVTGAVIQTVGGNETIKYAYDYNGHRITVPNYYYKVLLRLKSGSYDAIGFWFEHKSYGDVAPTREHTKSVDEIEALTGFDFFANLPDEMEEAIESAYLPSDWGY